MAEGVRSASAYPGLPARPWDRSAISVVYNGNHIDRDNRGAVMQTTRNTSAAAHVGVNGLAPIEWLDGEGARKEFDREARHWLRVSGEEFLRRWDAGAYADRTDDFAVRQVAILI